ncbi:MAG: TonB family protein [Bacteroidaceae bacterium]|nr:TonB family protein [Bacteroidaceae bacterium]
MKHGRMWLVLLMSIVTLAANAQVNEKMEELRSRGFGARNTAAAQVSAVADSVAKTEQSNVQGDTDPSFPGGEVFLQAYLKKKLLHSGVSGKGDVVVSFMVDKKGNIYNAEVTQSAGSTLDTAAFNIVTGMPRWRPGYTNGQPVDKSAKVTVSFGKEN